LLFCFLFGGNQHQIKIIERFFDGMSVINETLHKIENQKDQLGDINRTLNRIENKLKN